MTNIEKVIIDDCLVALILHPDDFDDGVYFPTRSEEPMQLGIMAWPRGHKIAPHCHRPVERSFNKTQEALFIRKGKIRVNFYSPEGAFCLSREVGQGAAVLLLEYGHGFDVVDDVEMIEIKLGPYVDDKFRFS